MEGEQKRKYPKIAKISATNIWSEPEEKELDCMTFFPKNTEGGIVSRTAATALWTGDSPGLPIQRGNK